MSGTDLCGASPSSRAQSLCNVGADSALAVRRYEWFGVGFRETSMCIEMKVDECAGGGPYAVIVSAQQVGSGPFSSRHEA